MEHELKTVNPHFTAQFEGDKTFEIRFADRPYNVGDTLMLQEYDTETDSCSGRWVRVIVTHILCEYPNIEDGYFVMSTRAFTRYTGTEFQRIAASCLPFSREVNTY